MEGAMYGGLKRYWKSRGYGRLSGSGRRRMNHAVLGGGSNRRSRRYWRIKIAPKLRRFSPKRLLIRLRDTYVNFMIRIANSGVVISSGYGGAIDNYSLGGFGRGSLKEYDEKMILEIYKSLVAARGQLVPRDAARIDTQIGYLPTVKE